MPIRTGTEQELDHLRFTTGSGKVEWGFSLYNEPQ